MSSAQARRLAIPAIGKLAGLADPKKAVSAFAPLLNDPHPQVRQYTIKALSAYGTEAAETLGDLQDIADNPVEKEYNRRDAALAENNIREALRIKEEQIEHTCIKCAKIVNHGEYVRSQKMFQRIYCNFATFDKKSVFLVSIHAPHAGSDSFVFIVFSPLDGFNPRPPRGERPKTLV